MTFKEHINNIFNHWSRQLAAIILTYIGIITFILTIILPLLQNLDPATWNNLEYSLIVITVYIFYIIIYVINIYKKNNITDIKNVLDIFPTYALFVRLLAGVTLIFFALISPSLRIIAIIYALSILLLCSISINSIYYNITFRFFRVLLDIFLASIVVYYSGKIESPFILLYFIPISVSARYFDLGPARGIAIAATIIIFLITFIDFNLNESFVSNYEIYVIPYLTMVVLIFLVGEILHAERRDNYKPIQESLLKINEVCQKNGSIRKILQELTNFLNSEVIITINSGGKGQICISPIGDHGYHFKSLTFNQSDYDNFAKWIETIDITAVSSYWDILYSQRKKIVDEAANYIKPLIQEEYNEDIISFIFTKLDEEKGYIIALNNKSANKVLIKPFTPDKYELLTISSTVVDDHPFFQLNSSFQGKLPL